MPLRKRRKRRAADTVGMRMRKANRVAAKHSTSVAKIRQLIVRCDKRELPAYIISGGQSNAIYLWGTLLEAGHDLKIGPIGRTAVDELWR